MNALRCCFVVAFAALFLYGCPQQESPKEFAVELKIEVDARALATSIPISPDILNGFTVQFPPSDQYPDGFRITIPGFLAGGILNGIDLGNGSTLQFPSSGTGAAETSIPTIPDDATIEIPVYAWKTAQAKTYHFQTDPSKKLETNFPGYITVGKLDDKSLTLTFEEKVPVLNVKPAVTVTLDGGFVWGNAVYPDTTELARMRIGASVTQNADYAPAAKANAPEDLPVYLFDDTQ